MTRTHKRAVGTAIKAARIAGMDDMGLVPYPYQLAPVERNEGVDEHTIIAPGFGVDGAWTLHVSYDADDDGAQYAPFALQIVRIGAVHAARVVGLSDRSPKGDRSCIGWDTFSPWMEIPSAESDEDTLERWILAIEGRVMSMLPRLRRADELRRHVLSQVDELNVKLARTAGLAGLRLHWVTPHRGAHQCSLRDAEGRTLYAATCDDPQSALDTVSSWTWHTLITDTHAGCACSEDE